MSKLCTGQFIFEFSFDLLFDSLWNASWVGRSRLAHPSIYLSTVTKRAKEICKIATGVSTIADELYCKSVWNRLNRIKWCDGSRKGCRQVRYLHQKKIMIDELMVSLQNGEVPFYSPQEWRYSKIKNTMKSAHHAEHGTHFPIQSLEWTIYNSVNTRNEENALILKVEGTDLSSNFWMNS